jgi:uncharacterized membrane protein YfcA
MLSGALLKVLFAILLGLVAVQMYFQNKPSASVSTASSDILPSLAIGFLTGLFSGFFGVGGGVV